MTYPTFRFNDDLESDTVIDTLMSGLSERIQGVVIEQTIVDAFLGTSLPAGWHYEATFPDSAFESDLGLRPGHHLTYTIEPVPDDPLIAALVLREE